MGSVEATEIVPLDSAKATWILKNFGVFHKIIAATGSCSVKGKDPLKFTLRPLEKTVQMQDGTIIASKYYSLWVNQIDNHYHKPIMVEVTYDSSHDLSTCNMEASTTFLIPVISLDKPTLVKEDFILVGKSYVYPAKITDIHVERDHFLLSKNPTLKIDFTVTLLKSQQAVFESA